MKKLSEKELLILARLIMDEIYNQKNSLDYFKNELCETDNEEEIKDFRKKCNSLEKYIKSLKRIYEKL